MVLEIFFLCVYCIEFRFILEIHGDVSSTTETQYEMVKILMMSLRALDKVQWFKFTMNCKAYRAENGHGNLCPSI